ncbi:MAG: CAP domain-containing protein [bacterium]|nr:CAP domain-containing protein [bacterium]
MSRKLVGILLSIAISLLSVGLWYLKTQPVAETPETSEAAPVLGTTTSRNAQAQERPEADKLYGLINGYRRDNKLSALVVDAALEKSARLKMNDMLEKKYWRHGDSNNYPPWNFFTQAGYHYTTAGENLAFGVKTSWQTFTNWQESPSHNTQLLESNYQDMGIAIECDFYEAYAGETCLVVLHLANT